MPQYLDMQLVGVEVRRAGHGYELHVREQIVVRSDHRQQGWWYGHIEGLQGRKVLVPGPVFGEHVNHLHVAGEVDRCLPPVI